MCRLLGLQERGALKTNQPQPWRYLYYNVDRDGAPVLISIHWSPSSERCYQQCIYKVVTYVTIYAIQTIVKLDIGLHGLDTYGATVVWCNDYSTELRTILSHDERN